MLFRFWKKRQELVKLYRKRLALLGVYNSEMRPGPYNLDGKLLFHTDGVIPRHVSSTTKSKKRVGLLDSVIEYSVKITNQLEIGNDSGDPEGAEMIVDGWGEQNILICPQGGWVKRYHDKPAFDVKYVQLRDQLCNYLSLPKCRISPNQRSIIEDFIEGKPISVYSLDEQIHHIHNLLYCLKKLVASEGKYSSNSQSTIKTINALRSAGFGQYLRDEQSLQFVSIFIERSPKVISHGDLKLTNIVISDSSPFIIDISPSHINYRHFWYDALCLTFRSMPSAFWNGKFDEDLLDLFDAAGLPVIDINKYRKLIVLIYLVWRSPEYFDHRWHERSSTPESVEKYVQRKWKSLSPS